MDSYANTLHSDEHSPTPIFFPPVPPVGQSSTYQTSISHPINIPCPPYPIPGILTPPDTPTSPFGFAMKQQLPTGKPTNQNVSFCVSTAYDNSAQTNDGAFVRAGKPLLRKKNNLSLRPGLRLNTDLEVRRHVHPVQESVSEEKIEAELCNEIETEMCEEIEAGLCCGVDGELDDEIELESCVKTQENESSDVDMTTYVGRESPVEKDRDRELRVLCFIGSDLRKIADQFQATYTRVRLFSPMLTFEISSDVFEM